MRIGHGFVMLAVVALLGEHAAFADAKSLLQRRAELEAERARYEEQTQEQPGDRTGVSTVNSTGSRHCDSIGGGLEKCTTSSSSGTQGGLSGTARGRIAGAKINLKSVEEKIEAIDEQLRALPRDEVLAAANDLGLVSNTPPSTEPGVGESAFRGLVEVVGSVFVPSAGSWNVEGRILGEGQRGTSNGIQGNGYTVGGAIDVVRTRRTIGVAVATEAEIGQYKDHGVIGSIGMDLGLGVRGTKAYASVTAGIHKTAGIYQSARWIPLLVHAGIRGRRLSLTFVGGYGWRPDLPKDGSPESMILSHGPIGTNSSLFKLMVGFGKLRLGLQYQDLDGLRIGSFVAGLGWLGPIDLEDK